VKKVIIRTITGLIFISIVIASVCWSIYSFMLVFLLVTMLCQHEFYFLIHSDNIKPQKIAGFILGAFLFLSVALYAHNISGFGLVLLNIPLACLIFVAEMYRKHETPFTNIAITLLGVYYIALPLSLLNFFYSPFQITGEFRVQLLLGFFIITWVTETAAYVAGNLFGKHLLFQRISPKKTWEGIIGAVLFGIITAFILSMVFKDFLFCHWLAIAMLIILAGTFGDLAESLFKRSCQVKDSGSLLPGHGGMLDRFDSILFAAPFVFLYIYIFIANSL